MYVKTVEHHQGYKVACLEEIAFNNHWISKQALEQSLPAPANSACKQRLQTAPTPGTSQDSWKRRVNTPVMKHAYPLNRSNVFGVLRTERYRLPDG